MQQPIPKAPNLKSSVDNVEISDEARAVDPRNFEQLRELGTRLNPDKSTYLGSFAVHIYANLDALSQARSIQAVPMQVGAEPGQSIYESTSSGVIYTGLELLRQSLVRDISGTRPRTLNKKDTRS